MIHYYWECQVKEIKTIWDVHMWETLKTIYILHLIVSLHQLKI
jgi:hypothetical protein